MLQQQEERHTEAKQRWGPSPGWERSGRIIWPPLLKLTFGLKAIGSENIPATGPVLLLANHTGFFDPPLIGAGCPRPIAFLGKAELFENPLLAFFVRGWGTYPLNRDKADASAVRLAMRVIRDEGVLCIFPEGTRTPDGHLQEFKTGTAKLALRLRAPIVPIGIQGGFEAYGRDKKLPRLGTHVTVRYGKPLELDWDQPSTPENIQRASDMIRERVADLLSQK